MTPRSASPATEDDILTGIIEAMLLTGWRVMHIRRSDRALVMGSQGFPDIIATPPHGGPVLVIETKSANGRVTDDQAAWLVAFAQAGVTAAVIRPDGYDRAVNLVIVGSSAHDAWAWSWRAA